MKVSQAFPSKYLSEPDLQDKAHVVIMAGCTIEEVGQDKKPILTFRGRSKGLALNKTNANMIASIYGDDTDNWIGKAIQLYPTTTEYKGQIKPCIRVRVAPATAAGPVSPPVDPANIPMDDDGIPMDEPAGGPVGGEDDIPF